MSKGDPVFYNCKNCPAWCCSYTRIPVGKKDLIRLSKHLGISQEKAKRKFTEKDPDEGGRILKHTKDSHFGSSCMFLDKKKRRCTVYEGRPKTCRQYPGTVRCGYYDFLMAERVRQEEDDHVATTDHRIT